MNHLAGWIELRAEFRAWVSLYGDWRRPKITNAVVLQTRNHWLKEGLRQKRSTTVSPR